ncbi:MAG: FtsX-like permease family protein [Idiomarina sp.]
MFKLALYSLLNRRGSAILTIVAIALSVLLLLGVERVRDQVRANFANTVSGTDIIVGARTGQVQLLLSSVFHIGSMTNTLSWDSYEYLKELPQVRWHIPLALGDSVGGAPVVATTNDFFEHFQYGSRQPLEFATGEHFSGPTDVVVGALVASQQGHEVGTRITIAHGAGGISFSQHDIHDFQVRGVLKATGTPVDKAVYIPLEGLALVHDEVTGTPSTDAESEHDHDHEHMDEHAGPTQTLSAVLLGLESKPYAIRMQRQINTYTTEPLTAIMPGMTLQQLWQTLSVFEQALFVITVLVVITGLLGMLTTLLASLRERRREMAVLRAVGAGPGTVFTLLVSEAALLTLLGCVVGVVGLYAAQLIAAPLLAQQLGLSLSITGLQANEWALLGLVLIAGILVSVFPAWRAYKLSLADGLTVKL